MEYVVLEDQRDVERATGYAFSGRAVHVEVGFEIGREGLEPKVELLRLLLDRVQRRFAVNSCQYVQHPTVDRRYLQSCAIDPAQPPGAPGGVREPRRPRPDPMSDAVALSEPKYN